MPKSAFAANAQAKACAQAIALLLRGDNPPEPKLINTCYSLVAPDYGISVAGVYQPGKGILADVQGAGGISPLGASPAVRATEAGLFYGEQAVAAGLADAVMTAPMRLTVTLAASCQSPSCDTSSR